MDKKQLEKYKQTQTLRSTKTQTTYMQFLEDKIDGKIPEKCIFCDKELFVKEFKHWIILENRFPYDMLYETSHMLATKRHVPTEMDLTINEMTELHIIKNEHLSNYDIILENIGDKISIRDHFHLHILRFKR